MSSIAASAGTAPPAADILRARILSALVLAPIALLALYAGELPLALLVGVFGAVGLWEWTRICGNHLIWLILGALVLAAACASIVWIVYTWRPVVVLWLFGAVWSTDIGAYAVGKWLRGPRIAPSISPNKTWTGLAGGMALSTLWSMAWASYVDSPLALAAGYGAVAAVIAQIGDFALSFAKRRFGVKDSSGLIPGHGGVLDRIAGLLTTAPTLALLLLLESTRQS